MKLLGRILSGLCVTALLAAAAFLLYLGIGLVVGSARNLDGAARGVLVLGALVALGCSQLLAMGLKGAKRSEVEFWERRDRAEIYWGLVEAWCAVRDGLGQLHGDRSVDVSVDLSALERRLAVWGSESVVQRYAGFRAGHPEQDAAAWNALEDVVLEMRKDLGQSGLGANQAIAQLLQYRAAPPRHDAAAAPGPSGEGMKSYRRARAPSADPHGNHEPLVLSDSSR